MSGIVKHGLREGEPGREPAEGQGLSLVGSSGSFEPERDEKMRGRAGQAGRAERMSSMWWGQRTGKSASCTEASAGAGGIASCTTGKPSNSVLISKPPETVMLGHCMQRPESSHLQGQDVLGSERVYSCL